MKNRKKEIEWNKDTKKMKRRDQVVIKDEINSVSNHANKQLSISEFYGQFFFQNDALKLQEVFSELGIRVFFENGLESFQTFLILQI
jgi:surfactin synthase thioesterase subunit